MAKRPKPPPSSMPAPSIADFTATPSSLPEGGGMVTFNAQTWNSLRNTINGTEVWFPHTMFVSGAFSPQMFTLVATGQTAPAATANVTVTIVQNYPPPPIFVPPPAPTISSFTPTAGGDGTSFTITGTNLLGATAVLVNSVPVSSYTVVSATSITAVVGTGTTTGAVTVSTLGGTVTSGSNFTINVGGGTATISSFTPTSGAVGTLVTITGTNFTGATAVAFNGVAATSFTVVSATSITATVATGTTTGTVAVTTPVNTATSSGSFTVSSAAPTISSFTPTTGAVGTLVTITGTNFTGATAVRFGGANASSFTVVSAASITATVANASPTGTVSVVTSAGTGTSSGSFTVTGGTAFGSGAATVTLANNNSATVQAALDAAVPGAIIQMQPGTTTWTTKVDSFNIAANVTLRGAGWNGADGGGDATIIIDNCSSSQNYLMFLAFPGTFRLSGVTFRGGTGTVKNGGVVGTASTTNSVAQFRMDHCHFDMPPYSSVMKIMTVGGGIRGVVDSCIFDLKNLSWIHCVNGRNQGDTEWSQATGFGTNDFIFIEDNQFNDHTTDGDTYNSAATDSHTGGKFVIRFNTLVATGVSQTHPTGHAGDDRGCRAHENYCNLLTSPLTLNPNFVMDYNNSGGAMVWGNSANQVFKNMLYLNNIRRLSQSDGGTYNQTSPPGGWGYVGSGRGPSVWDGNTDSAGYPGIDQPARGQGQLLSGQFSNSNRVNVATGTQAWPNQVLEPIYYWNNAGTVVASGGGSYMANLASGLLASNRDYYLGNASSVQGAVQTAPTSPFNGSTGCGWGTLANRPTSGLTVGVGYFATDQGSWNTTSSNAKGVQMNGASGVLYVATGANTWAAYYTPYAYPHPLRT